MTRENKFSPTKCESTHKLTFSRTCSHTINKHCIVKCHNLFMEYDSLLII